MVASSNHSATITAAAPEDQKSKICFLRVVFVASMAVAAAVCGTTAYLAVRRLETDLGEQTYRSVAASALKGAQAIMRRKFQASAVLASHHEYTFPNASQWPNVALPGFMDTALQLCILSNSIALVINVVVRPDQVAAFETFAQQTYQGNGYPNTSGLSGFGFGIWARDPVASVHPDGHVRDTGKNKSYSGEHAILTPVLQVHHPSLISVLLYNSYSEPLRAKAIDSMLKCAEQAAAAAAKNSTNAKAKPSCGVVTEFVELITNPGPAALLYWPVYPTNDPTTVVGMISTPIDWAEALTNIVPDYVDDLFCVIATKEKSFTYVINGGVPELLGEGDLHERAYDKYGTNVTLNDVETNASASVKYTLTIYPSQRMLEEFRSNSPVGISIGFIAVILFSASLFFLYDFFMRHESQQRKTILEVKRRFVRFVSHEIRTPLNTVCLGLELLQAELETNRTDKKLHSDQTIDECHQSLVDQGEKRKAWQQLTDDILENATNAVGILNDLLNYDKIEQGTFKLEVATVHIWELIRVTVSAFHIQAEKLQISLTLTSADVGNGASDEERPDLQRLHVVGDDTRLRQVVRNLISNSLKFCPEKTGLIQVTSTYNPDGLPKAAAPKAHILHKVATTELECIYPRAGSITIRVKDNGVGMTEEQLGHLFQEGVQFDANKHQSGGGSGLGLLISKGLVEQHGGTIVIDSEGPGLGATATIELPLYQFPESERARSIPKRDASIGISDMTPSVKKRRILVVDDSLPNRKMLVRLLERSGHVCASACNGQEAISMFESDKTEAAANSEYEPIDTILMDYEMPVLNGPDATKKLRQSGCTALVFGVTGNVLSEDIAYFKSMGANDVLGKPVQVSLLNELWGRHGQES